MSPTSWKISILIIALAFAVTCFLFALPDRESPSLLSETWNELRGIDVLNVPSARRIACVLELEHTQRNGVLWYRLEFASSDPAVDQLLEHATVVDGRVVSRESHSRPMSNPRWWLSGHPTAQVRWFTLPVTGRDSRHTVGMYRDAEKIVLFGRRDCWLPETNYLLVLEDLVSRRASAVVSSLGRGMAIGVNLSNTPSQGDESK